MVTAVVQLPGRLHSLPFFLAAWLLSYLAPHLLTAATGLLFEVATTAASPVVAQVGYWVVWIGLLPALFAWAQWLLMRRCLSSAIPWAIAVFAGTLLARIGYALVWVDPALVFRSPLAMDVIVALLPMLGATFAAVAVAALPSGLLFGVATAVPQAIVLPASKGMRTLWIAIMIPTEYASTVLGEGLYYVMRTGTYRYDAVTSAWPLSEHLIMINFAPRIAAWFLTAIVSGLLMHAVLRRRAGSAHDRLYAQFD
jgi:hypothetical protein